MTQTAHAPIPWIVDLPPNDIDITGISRASFIRACQGHEKIGDLLAYFILIASHTAKDQRIDTTAPDCTFVDISCKFENIVKKVKISRKSLGNYVKQLESLGYVDAFPYQRVYRVYFKKINAAIKSPPKEVKAKPRGKYAPPKPKPTQEEIDARKRLNLQTKLVKLQQKLVNLQTKVVSLHKELVNLPTMKTAESTPQAALEGVFEPPRTIQNSLESLKDSFVANIPASLSADADEGVSFEEKQEEGRTNGSSTRYHSGTTQQYSDQSLLHQLDASTDTHGTARAQLETLTEDEKEEGVGGSQEKAPNAPTTDPSPDSLVLPPTADTLQDSLLDAPMRERETGGVSIDETNKNGSCKISVFPGSSPPKKPKREEIPVLCQPRTVIALLDTIREHRLEKKGAIIHQNIVIQQWCQAHTFDECVLVIEHLKACHCRNEKHQWWGKHGHMQTYFNADKLAELTPGVLAELGKIPKPVPPEEARAAPLPPVSRGWSPVMTPCPRGR